MDYYTGKRINHERVTMGIKEQATNQAVQHTTTIGSKIATGMTLGGGSTAFIGGFTLNEFAMIFGMVVGLLGLCLQAYQTHHKRQVYLAEKLAIESRNKREEEEHRAKMGLYS